jgi:hypothetical protein
MLSNRQVARSYLQNVAEAVGKIVLAKEESWNYEPKDNYSRISFERAKRCTAAGTLIHMTLYFNRSIGSLIGFWD